MSGIRLTTFDLDMKLDPRPLGVADDFRMKFPLSDFD